MVYIVILNWNGWQDTIECLESVFRIDYPNFKVVVCDNASTDNSLNNFIEWAQGRYILSSKKHRLSHLCSPPVSKPISFKILDRNNLFFNCYENNTVSLFFIQTGSNLGFAGGNNVGIKFSLAQNSCDFIWLLNNDTIVEPDSLRFMVEYSNSKSDIGLCGSSILYYDNPDIIQYCGGGTYEKWFGIPKAYKQFSNRSQLPTFPMETENHLEYIAGSSMLVKRAFIECVGLLYPKYFLYFEEFDWALRGKKHNFRLGYQPKSIVYHKEGCSTGSKSLQKSGSSLLNDKYFYKNKIIFARKFFPHTILTIYLSFFLAICSKLKRYQFDRAWLLASIFYNDISRKRPKRDPPTKRKFTYAKDFVAGVTPTFVQPGAIWRSKNDRF